MDVHASRIRTYTRLQCLGPSAPRKGRRWTTCIGNLRGTRVASFFLKDKSDSVILVTRKIGKVAASTNLGDNPVYQELTKSSYGGNQLLPRCLNNRFVLEFALLSKFGERRSDS